jgi:hypothetical protein
MASLDDILTTQKNGVQAINLYTNYLSKYAGSYSTKELSASIVVKSSSGWVATVSVLDIGTTQGFLYDTNSTSTTSGNRIYAVPNVLGVYQVQIPFATGLVFVPGTSSVVSIGYS